MISVNGWDVWTVEQYSRLMIWLGDHGIEEDGSLLAELLSGDQDTFEFQAGVLAELKRVRVQVSARAPDEIMGGIDFAIYVLEHEKFPDRWPLRRKSAR